MTTKHTPGPWHYKQNGRDTYVLAPTKPDCSPAEVAKVRAGKMPVEANARLIAAAPELLIAAQMALQALIDRKLDGGMVGATLHEVIAKATGAEQ